MRIVMFGPPGSGKGTQGARLAARRFVPHVSTGDMLREARAAGTDLGRRVAEYLGRGHLVPDEIMTDMVAERLRKPDCGAGFVLDGFPRTVAQA
ncbi:MAG: adenylate kinase family protein, partial [Gemmatimonadales bacterium]